MKHFFDSFKQLDDNKKADLILAVLTLTTAIVNLLAKIIG